MSLRMKTAKRSAMLLPLAGMAGLAAHAQDASAVSAYVDSSYLFLIGGLIVTFMAAGFLCLESGLVRSKNASMQSLKNVALFSVAGLMFWLVGYNIAYPASTALGGIIGGAVGNLYDRLAWGAVADFVDLHILDYHWYVFNLADAAITLGVAALIIDSFRGSPAKD